MYDREWKLAFALFVLVGLLYWFVYHPYAIKQHCMKEATVMYGNFPGESARATKIDIAFQECVLRTP